MTSSQSQQGLCAHCNKPAMHVCGGCAVPRVSDQTHHEVRYCSESCLKLARVDHKAECKKIQAVRALYRAGETLRLLFFMYREKFYDLLVARTERRNGKLYLYEGRYSTKPHQDQLDQIFPLPDALFKDPKDKQAALTHLACADGVAYMSNIVQYFLGDSVTNLVEVHVQQPHALDEIITVNILGGEDKTEYPHEHFKLKLKADGLFYSLDFSGAQSGFWESVLPWDVYVQTRTTSRTTFTYVPLGHHKGQIPQLLMEPIIESTMKAEFLLNLEAHECLMRGTTEWEREYGLKASKVLELPQHKYEREQRSLINAITDCLQAFLDEGKKRSALRKAKLAKGR